MMTKMDLNKKYVMALFLLLMPLLVIFMKPNKPEIVDAYEDDRLAYPLSTIEEYLAMENIAYKQISAGRKMENDAEYSHMGWEISSEYDLSTLKSRQEFIINKIVLDIEDRGFVAISEKKTGVDSLNWTIYHTRNGVEGWVKYEVNWEESQLENLEGSRAILQLRTLN